jgi:hypothetical protein
MNDLSTMACPPKYRALNTFYQYYSGEKVRMILCASELVLCILCFASRKSTVLALKLAAHS